MTWWLVPSIVGVVVAGIIIGGLVAFFITKIRKRKTTSLTKIQSNYSGREQRVKSSNGSQDSIGSFATYKSPEEPIKKKQAAAKIRRAPETEKTQPSESRPIVPEPALPTANESLAINNKPSNKKVSDALAELEQNLHIATNPDAAHVINYSTEVWNNRRTEFYSLSQDILTELTEAYVDMLLANNVVWLVTELGRNSSDLSASYLRLSNKVAERLERIMPECRAGLS